MEVLLLILVALASLGALAVTMQVGAFLKEASEAQIGQWVALGWLLLVGGLGAAIRFGTRCEARGDMGRSLREMLGPEARQSRWELAAWLLGVLAAFLGGGLLGGLVPYWWPW